MQMMGLAGEHRELIAGGGPIARFVETTRSKRKRLVGPNHEAVRHLPRHRLRFFTGQKRSRIRRTARAGGGFHGAFVQIRDVHFDRNTGGFQHGPAWRTAVAGRA